MGRHRDQRGSLKVVSVRHGAYWSGRYRMYDKRGKAREQLVYLGLVSEVSEESARSKLLELIKRANVRSEEIHDIGPGSVLKRELEFTGAPQRHLVGAVSEMVVTADLLAKGYEVFRAVHGQASCDLIALKGGEFQRVEVKTDSDTLRYQIKRNIGKFDIVAVFSKETGGIRYVSAMELEILRNPTQLPESCGSGSEK